MESYELRIQLGNANPGKFDPKKNLGDGEVAAVREPGLLITQEDLLAYSADGTLPTGWATLPRWWRDAFVRQTKEALWWTHPSRVDNAAMIAETKYGTKTEIAMVLDPFTQLEKIDIQVEAANRVAAWEAANAPRKAAPQLVRSIEFNAAMERATYTQQIITHPTGDEVAETQEIIDQHLVWKSDAAKYGIDSNWGNRTLMGFGILVVRMTASQVEDLKLSPTDPDAPAVGPRFVQRMRAGRVKWDEVLSAETRAKWADKKVHVPVAGRATPMDLEAVWEDHA